MTYPVCTSGSLRPSLACRKRHSPDSTPLARGVDSPEKGPEKSRGPIHPTFRHGNHMPGLGQQEIRLTASSVSLEDQVCITSLEENVE